MITTSLYSAEVGWLHQIDPRVKLAMTLGLLVLVLLYQNLWFLIGLLGLELLLFISSRLPIRQLRLSMLTLLPVSLLMLLLRWVFYPQGQLLFSLGSIDFTIGGLAAGAVVAVRIVALAMAVLIWLGSTRNQDVIRSFTALGLPYDWGLSFALALRFLPDFIQTYHSIEQAQRARGLDLSQASYLQQITERQPILIAMLIAALRKSEQIAVALEARAFGSDTSARQQYRPLVMRTSDWLLLAIILFLLLVLIVLNVLSGAGSQPL